MADKWHGQRIHRSHHQCQAVVAKEKVAPLSTMAIGAGWENTMDEQQEPLQAQQFWRSLPLLYRQCTVAYQGILPSKQHPVATKDSSKANYIEQFNGTLLQRVSRFMKRSLAFSKSRCHPISLL